MIETGYAWIDLSTRQWRPYPISAALSADYIGGKGLAARLLFDLLPAHTPALSAENVVIVNTGPLCGTGAPSSSRFNISSRSVMTGGITSSNCGGRFGMKLRQAGFDGLILTGRASAPVFIEILDGEVTFQDASGLWGLDSEETQKAFPAAYGKLVIGPAGEHQVRYACLISDERIGGRGGLGAIFGAKNLKALVAYGTRQAPVADRPAFDALCAAWIEMLRSHPATGRSLPLYGTAGLLSKANLTRILPARNFSDGGYEQADEISGETLTERHLTSNDGCLSCVIRCARRVKVRGKAVKGPEYETVGLLGANIANNDLQLICDLNYQADLLGLDTVSLAATLSFAMELKEKGLADLGVTFGQTAGLEQVVADIAYRRGPGDELAEGSRRLSEKYGLAEAAQHVKGLELAAYDPRKSVGMGLGYATANRGGCHLNGGYVSFMEGIGPISLPANSPRSKPELTVMLQNLMESVSSAGSCFFTTYTLFPPFLYRLGPRSLGMRLINQVMLNSGPLLAWALRHPGRLTFDNPMILPHGQALALVTGEPFSFGRFLQAGERCFNMERLFNQREGFTRRDDRLPGRMSTPQSGDRRQDVVDLEGMLDRYYWLRGWEKDGRLTPEKLAQLGIEA